MKPIEVTHTAAFDRAKWVREVILRTTAECMTYTTWSAKFVQEEIQGIVNWMKKHEVIVNPYEMRLDEIIDLGFKRYSKDDERLYLIPLWFYQLLPNSFMGKSILDEADDQFHQLIKTDLDTDNRGGWLAYGIDISQLTMVTSG